MKIGFRVGDDNFAGARQRWQLPTGTAPLARVFPDKQPIASARALSPAQLVALIEAKAIPVRAAGMVPFFSIKPPMADTIAGAFDGHLDAVGRWCAAQPEPVYLSVWHEPQNDMMGAAKTDFVQRAVNFVAVYDRSHAVIKSVAGDQAVMGPIDMSYQWLPGTASTDGAAAEAWRVRPELMDFRGLDIYTSIWSWAKGRAVAEKADFVRWREWLSDDSKILLVERGIAGNYSTGGGMDPAADQAHILAADYLFLDSIGAHGLLYWHSGGATDNSSFLLTTPAARVFRQIAVVAAREPGGGAGGYERGRADAFGEIAAEAAVRRAAALRAAA